MEKAILLWTRIRSFGQLVIGARKDKEFWAIGYRCQEGYRVDFTIIGCSYRNATVIGCGDYHTVIGKNRLII